MVPLIFAACGEYNKVLKSKDLDYKHEKAVEYYNEGEYLKSMPLFEELLTLWRGMNKAEKVYYMYAMAHYKINDYYLAGYYFRQFTKTYPGSQYSEECAFLAALCHYKNSPKYSLDQDNTYRAIEELQIFVNRYPTSGRVDTCNTLIDNLRGKLEEKSYESARLYYKTENYKAAVVAFNNVLKDYPNSTYKEDILYLVMKSNYMLAMNSISSKKEQRLRETINSYRKFVDAFGESRYRREAENLHGDVERELEKY